MLQVALLAVFAAGAVLCFYLRLRVSMTAGALARGDSTPEAAAEADARREKLARRSALLSAAALLACILVGAAQRFL